MGKPTPQGVPVSESIGGGGDTWGTETSQYPEEKKSTEIPQVVASERGAAGSQQTLTPQWNGLERPA